MKIGKLRIVWGRTEQERTLLAELKDVTGDRDRWRRTVIRTHATGAEYDEGENVLARMNRATAAVALAGVAKDAPALLAARLVFKGVLENARQQGEFENLTPEARTHAAGGAWWLRTALLELRKLWAEANGQKAPVKEEED